MKKLYICKQNNIFKLNLQHFPSKSLTKLPLLSWLLKFHPFILLEFYSSLIRTNFLCWYMRSLRKIKVRQNTTFSRTHKSSTKPAYTIQFHITPVRFHCIIRCQAQNLSIYYPTLKTEHLKAIGYAHVKVFIVRKNLFLYKKKKKKNAKTLFLVLSVFCGVSLLFLC